MAGAAKELQANLKHLAWQANQVANGDYNQHVSFLGEFSDSFNRMVSQLSEREVRLKEQSAALEESVHLMKYDIHYTPRHGSWLNMAETELSSLSIQCLGNRRIETVEQLNEVLIAWEISRNQRQKGIVWHFKAEDARIKLYRLYPKPIFGD